MFLQIVTVAVRVAEIIHFLSIFDNITINRDSGCRRGTNLQNVPVTEVQHSLLSLSLSPSSKVGNSTLLRSHMPRVIFLVWVVKWILLDKDDPLGQRWSSCTKMTSTLSMSQEDSIQEAIRSELSLLGFFKWFRSSGHSKLPTYSNFRIYLIKKVRTQSIISWITSEVPLISREKLVHQQGVMGAGCFFNQSLLLLHVLLLSSPLPAHIPLPELISWALGESLMIAFPDPPLHFVPFLLEKLSVGNGKKRFPVVLEFWNLPQKIKLLEPNQ